MHLKLAWRAETQNSSRLWKRGITQVSEEEDPVFYEKIFFKASKMLSLNGEGYVLNAISGMLMGLLKEKDKERDKERAWESRHMLGVALIREQTSFGRVLC